MSDIALNRNELQKATGAPVYMVVYLRNCGRLPIARESKGRGYPTLYHHDAIEVVKEHMRKAGKPE